MLTLPSTAKDEQLLRIVDVWLERLADGDFAGALAITAHDPYYGWTPDRLQRTIAGYGDPHEPASHVVTRPTSTQDSQATHARRIVTRSAVPRHVGSGQFAIGIVQHDLPLDGNWSDLTAIFELRQHDDQVLLVLNDIHVL